MSPGLSEHGFRDEAEVRKTTADVNVNNGIKYIGEPKIWKEYFDEFSGTCFSSLRSCVNLMPLSDSTIYHLQIQHILVLAIKNANPFDDMHLVAARPPSNSI